MSRRRKKRRNGTTSDNITSWAKEHPWMTFFIITGAVTVIGDIFAGRPRPPLFSITTGNERQQ